MNGRVITDIPDARTRRCAEALMQHYPEDDRVGGIATFVRDVLTVLDAARKHEFDTVPQCQFWPDPESEKREAAEHFSALHESLSHMAFLALGVLEKNHPTAEVVRSCLADGTRRLDALEAMVWRRDGP